MRQTAQSVWQAAAWESGRAMVELSIWMDRENML